VPFWAKSPAAGNKMINARAEGIATKNAYRNAFKKKRCIVPADGFYEWHKVAGQSKKQPYFIHRADGEPIAFAGLWEEWKPSKDSEERLRSTTIITTTPNELMATIHDRMPVILPPSAWDAWLDPENADMETLGKLLVPAPSELLVMHPVSLDVGNVRNQGERLTEPIDPADAIDSGDPAAET
jgi:putative SOS response-associated peptidase YedK